MQQVAPVRQWSAGRVAAEQRRRRRSWIMVGVAVLSGLVVLGTLAPNTSQGVPVPTFPTTPTPDPLPLIADSGPPVTLPAPGVAVPRAALAAPAPAVHRAAPARRAAPVQVEPQPAARDANRKQSRRDDDTRIQRGHRGRGRD